MHSIYDIIYNLVESGYDEITSIRDQYKTLGYCNRAASVIFSSMLRCGFIRKSGSKILPVLAPSEVEFHVENFILESGGRIKRKHLINYLLNFNLFDYENSFLIANYIMSRLQDKGVIKCSSRSPDILTRVKTKDEFASDEALFSK